MNVNKIDTNAWTKHLFKFINVLFIILFSYYFALNIFGDIYKFIFSVVLFVPVTLAGFLLLPKIYSEFKDTYTNTLNRALAVMNVISFVLLLTSAIALRTEYYNDINEYSWDYGMVCDTAYRYAKYNELCVVDPSILPRYPNNHCIIYFLYYIFKAVNAMFPELSANGYQLISIVINCIFIETAVVLTLKLANKLLSPRKVFVCGCLLYTCIPIYAYASFYYTDTLAMPFVIGLLYVYTCFADTKSKAEKILLTLLFSVMLVIGFQIKATVIFVAVTVLFDVIFHKKSLKSDCKHVVAVVLLFIVLNNCLSGVYSRTFQITDEDYDTYKYPMTHWVMMALNPDGFGGWVRSDDFLTRNAGSYDDKVALNIAEIKHRVNELGVPGVVKRIFYTKADRTWASGSLSADLFLSMYPKNKTILHEFFTYEGKFHAFYSAASMFWHSLLMLLVAVSAVKSQIEKRFDKMLIIFLPLLMLALFLMVWESNSRYIFHILPLLIIAGADSLDFAVKSSEKFAAGLRHKAA